MPGADTSRTINAVPAEKLSGGTASVSTYALIDPLYRQALSICVDSRSIGGCDGQRRRITNRVDDRQRRIDGSCGYEEIAADRVSSDHRIQIGGHRPR